MARVQSTTIPMFVAAGHVVRPRTVNELCDLYQAWADVTYVQPTGEPTRTNWNVRNALEALRQAAGAMPPVKINTSLVRYIQEQLANGRLARATVNDRIDVIKRMVRWAAERELIEARRWHSVAVVSRLRPYRSNAREPQPVKPIRWDVVEPTMRQMCRQVAAMTMILWSTGMRIGELCRMRPRDIDRTGKVWMYECVAHKTRCHGKRRMIPIGPAAQTALRPYLEGRAPDSFVFSPRASRFEHQMQRALKRRVPVHRGNRIGSNRVANPQRVPGLRYTSNAFLLAVYSACDKAWPHPELGLLHKSQLTSEQRADLRAWRIAHRWHPHQIRHAAATRIRAAAGVEAAKVILGHSDLRVTEIYAERDYALALEVMDKMG